MGPPVRVVCGACLQSSDVSSEGWTAGAPSCPFCGSEVEKIRHDSEFPTSDHTPTASPPDSSEGSTIRIAFDVAPGSMRIGRFVLGEPLGEGGYGQVFRAYDPHLDRDVALKVLKTARLDEKAIERFFREARAAARLDHPNIVGLYDAGRDDGRCWIAYQLITGRTLSHIRDVERPSIPEAARIVRDLALALEHAHSRGVFHRDLKPANVMIDDSGRTRLTDFGLARRGDLDSELTREGTILGTPQYMSPEAAAGRSNQADARSDVYSLGVILYELICGRKPVDVPTGTPAWRFRPNPTPPTPRSVDRTIPAGLDRVCMKALAFNPDDRYPDARSFAEALDRHAGPRPGPATVERASSPSRAPASCPRRSRVIGAVVAASGLALAVVLALRPGGPAPKASAPIPPSSAPVPALVASAPDHAHDAPPANADAPPETPPVATTPGELPVSTPPAGPSPPNLRVVGNTNKKTFHRPGCPALNITYDRNQKDFADAEEALAEGYVPCGRCKPTQPDAPPGTADKD